MNLRSLLPACALLAVVAAPELGRAQTMPITLTDDLQTARGVDPAGLNSNITLSLTNCQAATPLRIAFTWTKTPTPGANETEHLFFSTSNSCGDGSTDVWQTLKGTSPGQPHQIPTEQYLVSQGLTVQDVFSFAVNPPPAGGAAQGPAPANACPNNLTSSHVFLCIKITDSTNTTNPTIGFVQFSPYTAPPPTPSITNVSPLSGGADVSWTVPSTSTLPPHYMVRAIDAAGNVISSPLISSTTQNNEKKLSGLTNGTPYTITVVSIDNAGIDVTNNSDANVSPPSPGITITPQPVVSYLQGYVDSGGEASGCASGGGTGLATAVVLVGWLMRRRRGWLLALTVASLLSGSARASDEIPPDIHTPEQTRRQPSARHFTFQFDLGPYGINADSASTLNGSHPYKDYFGTGKPLITRLEADVDFFSKFGRASVGLAFGFWQAVGKARTQIPGSTGYGDKTLDTELLNMYPLSLLLVYRADFLFERWHFPLVPYGKVGYGFVKYSDLTDGNLTKITNPTTGKTFSSGGWATGLQYAVGLQFVLDIIDLERAASLDQDFGINSTSVFVEFGQTNWTGSGGNLNLGGSMITGGFAFAF